MTQDAKPAEVVVDLQAEELAISRRLITGDTVRVATSTVEHEHDIDETLFKERIEVERVPVGREVPFKPEIVEDGDLTIIPVVEEIVVVTRKIVLKEEIHLRRVRTASQHRETVVLRKQQAIVTREAPTGSANSTQEPFNPGENHE